MNNAFPYTFGITPAIDIIGITANGYNYIGPTSFADINNLFFRFISPTDEPLETFSCLATSRTKSSNQDTFLPNLGASAWMVLYSAGVDGIGTLLGTSSVVLTSFDNPDYAEAFTFTFSGVSIPKGEIGYLRFFTN